MSEVSTEGGISYSHEVIGASIALAEVGGYIFGAGWKDVLEHVGELVRVGESVS